MSEDLPFEEMCPLVALKGDNSQMGDAQVHLVTFLVLQHKQEHSANLLQSDDGVRNCPKHIQDWKWLVLSTRCIRTFHTLGKQIELQLYKRICCKNQHQLHKER